MFNFLSKLFNKEYLTQSAKISLVIAPIIAFYTPVSHLFVPLLFLATFDIITGVLKSLINHIPISSYKLIARKPAVIAMWFIGLSAMLFADKFLLELHIVGNWGAKIYIVFYALYELLSILENLADSGLPGAKFIIKLLRGKLPKNIDQQLEAMQKEEDKKEACFNCKKMRGVDQSEKCNLECKWNIGAKNDKSEK